jgi:hypothetical protein
MTAITVLLKMERFDFSLTTYRQGKTAPFYIQSKGLHSGRPLKKPIPNCFCVHSSIENLYEIVFAMYKGKLFEPIICGSVVPFIRIDEVKYLINKTLSTYKPSNAQKLKSIEKIDLLLSSMASQIKLYTQMQTAICREILT